MKMLRNAVVTIGIYFIVLPCFCQSGNGSMSKEDKKKLKLKVIEMFDHAYNSYKKYAHPADELMPLSCKGRFRGSEKDRGDIDEALGNFSLTLIDTLDTLVVFGKFDEFDKQVEYVINNVSFDTDVVVSVFETNIRVLGGLLGAHSVAITLKESHKKMLWYNNELLAKATDIADRLLPAFNTTTGIPYPKVNLRYGVNTAKARVGHETDTCTACAGTMIMEFGALSRMTGNQVYEEKAHHAMEALWKFRSVHTNLVGTTINIHNGNWIRRDSGVGAGIDSYYEYCLKAYILFGDEWYLQKFNKHYEAIDRYIRNGFMLVDVLMHEPLKKVRSHMDSLQAFWPGLQVLKGDLQSAIETHEMLYTVAKKFKFLPEAFTTDFNVHWAQHPLRPEFVESTYFLYEATRDSYYLHVGKHVIESLEEHARVPCGFAALKDLRTLHHEDKMDSFVLAETFKYLYLLFSEESERVIDIHDFIFTTEAHLLPLYLSTVTSDNKTNNETVRRNELTGFSLHLNDDLSSCPNHRHGISDMLSFAQKVRRSVNIAIPAHQKQAPMCTRQPPVVETKIINEQDSERILTVIKIAKNGKRKLKAEQFIMDRHDHLQILKDFGISIQKGDDGKVQLMHQSANAATPGDAEEGLLFMQEMIQLSKQKGNIAVENHPRVVQLLSPPHDGKIVLTAGSAQFGEDLSTHSTGVSGVAVESVPFRACETMDNDVTNKIAVVERGNCMFIDKVRLAQSRGALGVVIVDHMENTSIQTSQQFSMSGDSNPSDVKIPSVFLFRKEGDSLREYIKESEGPMEIRLAAKAFEKDEVKNEVNRAVNERKTVDEKTFTSKLDEKCISSADRQEVQIEDDGRKTMATIYSFVGPDGDRGIKKHILKKIETCPTTECNFGVKIKYEIETQSLPTDDLSAKGASKEDLRETTESGDQKTEKGVEKTSEESYIENFISEALRMKNKKTGAICTSAGCFDDIGELLKMNNLADGILDKLKKLQNKLESNVVELMKEREEKLREYSDLRHMRLRDLLNEEKISGLHVEHEMDLVSPEIGENNEEIKTKKTENENESEVIIERKKEEEIKNIDDENSSNRVDDKSDIEKDSEERRKAREGL